MPEVSATIPGEIMAAIQRERTGAPPEAGLRRLRVTFVSSSPRDLEAELELMRRGPE